MNKSLAATLLAVVGSAAALLMPGTSQAGNVGYYTGCYESGAAKAPLITQAGHTPVAVAALNSASLSSLATLVIENCNGGTLSSQVNADVTAAVAGGMTLVVYDWSGNGATAAALPGAPAANITSSPGVNIDLAAGTPIATGPGGTLTNASLDNGDWSYHGYATTLPGGAVALITTTNASQLVGFSYAYGAGRVIWSGIPFDCYLGECNESTASGIKAYFVNVLAWGGGTAVTTCASEGYTGTKLSWCKNICESDLPQATLDIWIHRWVNRYRDLPYCAVEEEEEPPQEG